ncbi:MAG: chorismate-binding protein [Bacteroidia bacterium]|nr:chorismate-binding protein [Bacteroidia bacterium]
MDNQFLLLRSPRKNSKDLLDYYSGFLVDWDGKQHESEHKALIKSWDGEKIRTFKDGGVEIAVEELKKKLGDMEILPSELVESSTWSHFSEQVEKIKEGISQNKFEKAVLSRVKWVEFQSLLSLDSLLQIFKLACTKYPNSLVYLLCTNEYGVWMGASPEILVEIEGDEMRTMSLAGTLFNPDEKWSDKEEREQSVTALHISETLNSLGLKEKISEVEEITNGSIRHLVQYHKSHIQDVDLGQLISKLHPTPAVAGYPVNKSVQMIEELEQHERELYTGFIGDTQEVYVNLRCAQIFKNGIKLFAGCGINSQSDSEREWQETELKMRVIGDLFVV